MNIFNRKAKAQEVVIKAQAATIAKLEASELYLMGQIREMDQLIFRMSQASSWDQMRPIFHDLKYRTDHRMKLESDRIATVLIPEMKKAYRQ